MPSLRSRGIKFNLKATQANLARNEAKTDQEQSRAGVNNNIRMALTDGNNEQFRARGQSISIGAISPEGQDQDERANVRAEALNTT